VPKVAKELGAAGHKLNPAATVTALTKLAEKR